MIDEPKQVGDILEKMTESMFGPAVWGQRMRVMRSGERDPISTHLRAAIHARDGFQCAWCWSNKELQIDHLIPWSAGGSDDPTNLRTLCGPCNRKRSNYETDSHSVAPKAVTRVCLRCTGEDSDSTVQEAFCLTCRRFTPTRWDQIRQAQRYFATDAIVARNERHAQ